MHDLSLFAFELPTVEEWLAGDDRVLAFQVTDDAENPVDISNATVSWGLWTRPYQDADPDAVLTDADSGVEVVTDTRVDTTNGEFEVRVDGEATDGEFGEYCQRPLVEQSDGTEASWRGKIILTA